VVVLAFELLEDFLLSDFSAATYVVVASGPVSHSDFLGMCES